jgi:hypothetical protein
MADGKTSDCRDATQPRIQIPSMIPTNAHVRFQRKLTSALPDPEIVSVRKIRPRNPKLKPTRSKDRVYCWIPRGPLMIQMRARIADMPVKVPAIRLVARDSPDSRPISINVFSSERFAHQR